MYRGRLGSISSKVLTRVISLGSSLVLKLGWNRGGMLFSAETYNISEKGQDGTKVTIDDYRKTHTRFRMVPKSTTLDDLERALCTPFQSTCTQYENLNEDRPTLSAAKM